jgi:hypothetical protein
LDFSEPKQQYPQTIHKISSGINHRSYTDGNVYGHIRLWSDDLVYGIEAYHLGAGSDLEFSGEQILDI